MALMSITSYPTDINLSFIISLYIFSWFSKLYIEASINKMMNRKKLISLIHYFSFALLGLSLYSNDKELFLVALIVFTVLAFTWFFRTKKVEKIYYMNDDFRPAESYFQGLSIIDNITGLNLRSEAEKEFKKITLEEIKPIFLDVKATLIASWVIILVEIVSFVFYK